MTSSLHSMLGDFAKLHAVDAPAVPVAATSSNGTGGHGIAGLGALMGRPETSHASTSAGHSSSITLSDEQRAVIDAALEGHDVIVEAVPGSGKTFTIQQLCNELNEKRPGEKILYLTYSRLLKDDARARVTGAKVQNYHGIVYPGLLAAGIKCGLGESIAKFNENFDAKISASFETYDVIVVDEYQDITEEYAELLRNIKSKNPVMQVIMVGDLEQKVSASSNHDAQKFAREFCVDPVFLPFTRSFRLGPEMATKLGQAWNKPITGVNEKQRVELMSFNDAVREMLSMRDRVGDILCLGKRNGKMTDALNKLETDDARAFNKNTVYASVKDKGSQVSFTPNSAIFTTFDSSKGLERDTCFIFDYTPQMFEGRLRFPDADPTVLRNVFLVAASRGKSRIIFVDAPVRGKRQIESLRPDAIGGIPISKFVTIGERQRPKYERPFNTAEMFHFKYVETVDAAFDLLDCRMIQEPSDEPLILQESDGLIDLTSVINEYQKNMFFDDYDVTDAVVAYGEAVESSLERHLRTMRTRAQALGRPVSAWDESLALTAAMTNYDRYAQQVSVEVSAESMKILRDRLSEHVSPASTIQRYVTLDGEVQHTRAISSEASFAGVIDVVEVDSIVQLHYAAELDHPMFLQAAMLAIMADKSKAVVWNTRTNERWEVRVPDEQRFLDAVTLCVTKQSYKHFKKDV